MESQQRFLHWILHSPSLFELKPPFAQLQPLDVSLPSALPPYQGNKRLGFLYQHLCSTLFQNTNTIDFIEEELQLKDHQRTLGAIDFMLRNTAESSYQHWEVAIKFYLLCDGLWYGPNAKDRLDKKLSHMLNHQLKMSSNEAFLATHPQYRNCSEHLLMQGRLYINPFLDQVIPQECLGYRLNAQVITGYWCFAHQWPQIPGHSMRWKNTIGPWEPASLTRQSRNHRIGLFTHKVKVANSGLSCRITGHIMECKKGKHRFPSYCAIISRRCQPHLMHPMCVQMAARSKSPCNLAVVWSFWP